MYKSEIRELKRIILQEARRTLRENRGEVDDDLAEEIFYSTSDLLKSIKKFESVAKDKFDSIYSTLAPMINPLKMKLDEIRDQSTKLATKIDNSGEKVIIGGDKKGKQP
jgi:DNA-directed RNA polymerase subunit F